MTVGNRKIFKPVLCVKRAKNFEKGLALMNTNPFAIGSVIFTKIGHYARAVACHTGGGMIGLNVGIPVLNEIFPSNSRKQSFFGNLYTLGKDGYRFYTERRVATTRWFNKKESNHQKSMHSQRITEIKQYIYTHKTVTLDEFCEVFQV